MTKLSGPMVAPPSGAAPRHAVVLLHGYGSDGADLISLAPAWQDAVPDALFVAPNAPTAARMLGYGFQWFDIALEGNRLASRQLGIGLARPVLVEFLADLWAQTGIPPERTVLAGFSQGAMMALHVGLSLDRQLMGIVAFSGAFLPPENFGDAARARPPVCLVHGDSDDVVDVAGSLQAEPLLREAGVDVSMHVSGGVGHGIDPEGLAFATAFLRKRVGELSGAPTSQR